MNYFCCIRWSRIKNGSRKAAAVLLVCIASGVLLLAAIISRLCQPAHSAASDDRRFPSAKTHRAWPAYQDTCVAYLLPGLRPQPMRAARGIVPGDGIFIFRQTVFRNVLQTLRRRWYWLLGYCVPVSVRRRTPPAHVADRDRCDDAKETFAALSSSAMFVRPRTHIIVIIRRGIKTHKTIDGGLR